LLTLVNSGKIWQARMAEDLGLLFESIIICIPRPRIDKDGALQMLVVVVLSIAFHLAFSDVVCLNFFHSFWEIIKLV
jgi:hypothetical protein